MKHLRFVKRGTPHVHGCPLCQRWRDDPPCTDTTCDIVGELGDDTLVGGKSKPCCACRAEYEHEQSLRALRAFGRVVATIARVALVERASRGGHIDSYNRNPVGAAYYGPEPKWFVYAGQAVTPTHELPSPHPADRAAEVVSLLFGEAEP